MGLKTGGMHVATVTSRQRNKAGQLREYHSHLVRRSYRQDGKVKHQTVANLTALPAEAIEAVRAVLRGQSPVPADRALSITQSVPHGHVAAVWAMAQQLGLPKLLGRRCRHRDLALALIISRVVRPRSKLSTTGWWAETTLGADLGVAGASTDEAFAAMDWLGSRQDAIEAKLAKRHLSPGGNPAGMALFDLSSSWMEGSCCPLAARGYSRDGKKAKTQIEYGLLTDPDGRPVAVRVFPGNTGDPTSFKDAVGLVRDKFGLSKMIMVGDRGMITSARIDAIREDNNDPDKTSDLGWLTALRAPAIKKLAADDGPLQMSLFDEQNLAEITSADFPGERLICCRNPALAEERARKREALLAATEKLLAPLVERVSAGRLAGADAIGVKVGKDINHYKMSKHFTVDITDTSLAITRNTEQIEAEAALDGIYVIRTSVPDTDLDAGGVVGAYKSLAGVERDFRHIKVDDLDLRPIYHRLEDRVRAHVFLCTLAAYLVWHLRQTLAPLTYTDEHPPAVTDPVAAAHRSADAEAKASTHTTNDGLPARSFRDLLDHLATLTRNDVRIADSSTTVAILADATPSQRRVFELLEQPLPVTLTPT